ncbi:MAG: VWA domain-containing protein [Planctomycetes bacterium]|nr:VWA domain-containing protein [Planctomycetota bacterium]
MIVSLLLITCCALQSTPSSTWANLVQPSEVPRRGFEQPRQSLLQPLLSDVNAPTAERLAALKALAYLDVDLPYKVVIAIRPQIRGEESTVSYIRCLARTGIKARPALTKYLKNRLPAIRAEATYALVKFFDNGRQLARSVLDNPKAHVWQRVAALRGLADVNLSLAQVAVMRRVLDESGSMLLECLEVLRRDLSGDHVALLIDLLKRARCRATIEAVVMLRMITGYNISDSYEQWRRMYLKHKVKNEPMRALRQTEGQLNTVSYLGIPIFSGNICFVLDSSSSMNTRMQEMKRATRAAKVVTEFKRMLQILPGSSSFNVVFFETYVHEMSESLLPASPQTKEYAEAYVGENDFSGGTNMYGGIRRAFELDGVEEIIVLSDGDPSEGEYTLPWQILMEIERINRWQNIRVSTISFSAPPAAQSLMYTIAAQNLGHFKDVK